MTPVARSTAGSPRPSSGTLPPATTLDDESYLDAVEGFYDLARRAVGPATARAANAHVETTLGHGPESRDIQKLRAALDVLTPVAIRNRLYRSTQDMMWRRIRETYDRVRPVLEQALATSERTTGGLELDPGFELPPYYATAEFHLQPGSYHGDALAGFWYHYGSKIVFLGQNDHDEIHRTAASLAPVPADAPLKRVLDLGCSLGQSTTALKARFPAADVDGIDVATPMLRYAHHRARLRNAKVTFRQRRAERTGYGDGEFDLVYAFLLFHEMPGDIAAEVLTEAHRILRPGGHFVIVDNAAGDETMTPFRRYTSDFSRRFNGEAYAFDFDTSDFMTRLHSSPFSSVEEMVFSADVQLPFRMWVLRR